jgi:hypothetical protein
MKGQIFPRLRQIYFERAKKARNRHALGLLISGSIATLLLCLHPKNGSGGHLYLAAALVISAFYLVKTIAILYGLKHFDRAWREQIKQSLAEHASPNMYEEIEEELGGDTAHFRDVIFTRNYLIAFKKMGAMALVSAVTDLEANLRKTYSHGFSFFKPQYYHELSCKVEPLGTVILSTDSDEMHALVEEIMHRNQTVCMSEESIALLGLQ